MDAMEVARGYFDAWNRRDPTAIVATFTGGGIYRDPPVPDDVTNARLSGVGRLGR
jgi:hypothetical protein